ncbi:PA0069 family radical SAM protein [Henriciella pelagia]|jgi:DNA repair photolyase|uniref:Radical SAM protein n=1 Tax=Henriciella pelagia TaxID=1977912 RepID=A0ABQ1JE77_9PROT|nr:PA0069 family radical SAM protein [Henriciella pelagia]GGB63977.1 radical SAM protein [Henriciella pelagia]
MRQTQKLSKKGRVTLIDVAAAGERFEQRGRGAISNQAGRFEHETHAAFDDGWGTIDDEAARLKTTLTREVAKTIITYNRSPDISFDRTINPYRGCEHGCVYCFARPTHAFHGLSAGLDFESRIFFKPGGPDLLRRELSRPSYVPKPIALGMNTDAYQPVERQLKLTRTFLEILSAHNHPVTLLTKSALIQRDIDIIAPMAAKGIARVGVSITTLDPRLSRRMEPRAAAPYKRLQTVRALADAGIEVIVMTAPIIPALNEHEIEPLLEAAADNGARSAGYVLLRLPFELKDIFHEWLAEHYPDRAARIINLLRAMRGGQDYDSNWFERGRGQGPHARLIAQRFQKAARRLRLDTPRSRLRTDLFCPPEGPNGQLKLDV